MRLMSLSMCANTHSHLLLSSLLQQSNIFVFIFMTLVLFFTFFFFSLWHKPLFFACRAVAQLRIRFSFSSSHYTCPIFLCFLDLYSLLSWCTCNAQQSLTSRVLIPLTCNETMIFVCALCDINLETLLYTASGICFARQREDDLYLYV